MKTSHWFAVLSLLVLFFAAAPVYGQLGGPTGGIAAPAATSIPTPVVARAGQDM